MVEPRAARYREVFAVAEFRALFAAQLLSVTGDQFARVALAVLVYARTGSATLTALTYALTFLPSLVAGPLLSGLADRYPRRRVMIATDLARAVLVAGMAVPGLPLGAVLALLIAVQVLAEPFKAARAATLPAVLAGDRYVVAVAVSGMTYQGAQLLGFAAGGLLVAGVDPSGALLVDSLTFVLSAAVIRRWVAHRPAPIDQAAGQAAGDDRWLRRIAVGAKLVWADRGLRAMVALMCVAAFPVTIEGLAVPYAADLGAGAAAVGVLMAAEPAGSLLGLLLIRRVAPTRRLRLIRPLAVGCSLVLVFCAMRPGLGVTILLWMTSGVLSAYLDVTNAVFVRAVPDFRRGQAVGLASTALRVSQGVAVLAAGAAADLVPPAFVVAAAGGLGAVAAWVAATEWLRRGQSADGGAPADRAT